MTTGCARQVLPHIGSLSEVCKLAETIGGHYRADDDVRQ
jgi:hypothetical protein